METYAHNETLLRRTARRYSLCADDVDDALQRGLEILLRKGPTDDPRELIKWMQTVVKHEALAIRRERERILAAPVMSSPSTPEDWVDLLPTGAEGPAEKAERREEIARSREALQELKPQELRALTLLAEGYSYVEIGEITGYSRTKINRCLAEGRARYRNLVARSEDGRRCAELAPLLSAFCDGEAAPAEVARVREHLRACVHCRATLRAYRAAPAAAAALTPLPLDRSLWERVHDAVAGLATRLGGGGAEPATQLAGGGAGGLGAAGIAKVAALCVGTAGGAAACVAGGMVPVPLDLSPARERAPLERRLSDRPTADGRTPTVAYEPAPATPEPQPRPEPKPQPEPEPSPPAVAPAASEPVVEAAPEASSGGAEYAPPPAPEPTAAPAAPPSSSSAGSPAGEFGP